jgi:hypothetical protein
LHDFLARLGFEVDGEGAKRFNAALATSATRVAAFGASIQAMAVGAYAAIYRVAQSKSEMLALADSVGVPVARIQELGYVAEANGASVDALTSSLEGLTSSLGQAAIGQGGGREAFHRLSIAVHDANGRLRNSADVLLEVGDRLRGMDPAKASMFMDQLGIDRSLLRMVTSDVDGLRAAYQQMYQAVGVDADQAAEDSRKFVGEVGALKAMLQLVADAVASIFMGQMGADVRAFRVMVQDNVGKIVPVLKTVIDVILRLGKAFGALTARLLGWVGTIIDWFGRLDASTQTLILGVLGFAAAWRYLNLSFLLTPLGAIIAGFVALLALIDDFTVWRSGGDSLVDWGPWAEDIDTVVQALGVLLSALGQVWDVVKGPLVQALREFWQLAIAVFGGLVGAVAKLVVALVQLFQGDVSGALGSLLDGLGALGQAADALVGYIFKVFSGLGDAIGGSLGWLVEGVGKLFGFRAEAEPASQGAPVLAPSPTQAAAATAAGGGATVNAQTTIQVSGTGEPEAVARRVASSQDRVNADMVRHAKGAAR